MHILIKFQRFYICIQFSFEQKSKSVSSSMWRSATLQPHGMKSFLNVHSYFQISVCFHEIFLQLLYPSTMYENTFEFHKNENVPPENNVNLCLRVARTKWSIRRYWKKLSFNIWLVAWLGFFWASINDVLIFRGEGGVKNWWHMLVKKWWTWRREGSKSQTSDVIYGWPMALWQANI